MGGGKRLADHAAQRQTGEMDMLDIEVIENGHDIIGEIAMA